MNKITNKYLFICSVLVCTWALLKGFCTTYPCPVRLELIVLIVEFVIFVMCINKQSISDKLKFVFRDNIGWIVFIFVTLILVALTYYADIRLNTDNASISEIAVWKSVIDFAQGVLGTLIGIWAVYVILRPKLKIYSFLAIQDDDKKLPCGIVLVKNTNWTDLMNVEIFLQCCWKDDNGNLKVCDFKTTYPSIPLLRNKLYANECTHAWLMTVAEENKHLGSFEDFINASEYVRCRIIATHSLSGIRFVTEHNFSKEYCKRGIYDNNNKFIQS